MSTTSSRAPGNPARPAITPMIGALLRLPHEVIVARMLSALHGRGFDLSITELGVFLFPGPEGRRPADLARQCKMTRQAMNYVLAGLERDGYLERRAGTNATARAVYMTAKGWEVVARIRDCVVAIEQEWAAHLGTQRFKTLRETLYDLSRWLGALS